MKVTMRHNISGTRNGQQWPARGESIDLPTDEAEQLIDLGLAEAASKPEKADEKPQGERQQPEKRPAAKRAEKR